MEKSILKMQNEKGLEDTCLRFGEEDENGENAGDNVDSERKTKEKREYEIWRRKPTFKTGKVEENNEDLTNLGKD